MEKLGQLITLAFINARQNYDLSSKLAVILLLSQLVKPRSDFQKRVYQKESLCVWADTNRLPWQLFKLPS